MSTSLVTAAVAELLTTRDATGHSRAGDRDRAAGADEVAGLVEAAQAGSREAFGELVTLHETVVYRTALAALARREDAEDVAQEAFVLAWRKLAGFRGDATFRTWLLAIVWRKALDRRRARQLWWSRTAVTAQDAEVDRVETLADALPGPEQTTLARDLARRVRDEIGRLRPKLRDALLLASSGEYSYGEIAEMLRIPIGTLKWRVAEARRIVSARVKS
jgi:RNA polymerase sigma-70 factor (ECF subfamily)